MKKHFGVAYLKDGTISITKPKNTREEVVKVLENSLKDEALKARVERTTIIVREVDEKDEYWRYIFGSPNSLNLIKDDENKKEKVKAPAD